MAHRTLSSRAGAALAHLGLAAFAFCWLDILLHAATVRVVLSTMDVVRMSTAQRLFLTPPVGGYAISSLVLSGLLAAAAHKSRTSIWPWTAIQAVVYIAGTALVAYAVLCAPYMPV